MQEIEKNIYVRVNSGRSKKRESHTWRRTFTSWQRTPFLGYIQLDDNLDLGATVNTNEDDIVSQYERFFQEFYLNIDVNGVENEFLDKQIPPFPPNEPFREVVTYNYVHMLSGP